MTNREIKFRGWDKKRKEMFYFDKEWWISVEYCSLAFPTYRFRGGGEAHQRGSTSLLPIREGVLTLTEYTSLTDKNGKEIYEGDILKVGNKTYLVAWVEAGFMLVNGNYEADSAITFTDAGEDIKVIGNEFENEELLDINT